MGVGQRDVKGMGKTRTCSKRFLMFSSEFPETPETMSVAATSSRGTLRLPAMARTSMVLPQPGGPRMRMPCGVESQKKEGFHKW